MSNLNLPNVREPFIDPRSGQISRPWWIWLQQLMTRVGGSDGADIAALETLVRVLIRDVLALERAVSDEHDWQISAGLALQIEELQAACQDRGHGFWEDPDMHAVATATDAGFMSAADKAKLDGITGNTEDIFVSGVDFTPGVTTSLSLSKAYASEADVLVHFDGTFQGSDQYGISGATITFTSAIPVGVSTVYARG